MIFVIDFFTFAFWSPNHNLCMFSVSVQWLRAIIIYSLLTGSWKLKSWSNSSFGLKSTAAKLLKQASVILTFFLFRLLAWETFCATVTSSWRHYVRALRKSCVREVICQSPPSMAEGMPAFRQAVWQCIEGRRAAGTCSWAAEGRNRQQFFRHAIRRFQM